MKVGENTLEALVRLINEAPIYRKRSELVQFFNELGFQDADVGGFGSRHDYTHERLRSLNGGPGLDKAIKNALSRRNLRQDPAGFKKAMDELNGELQFDGWNVFWDDAGEEVSFRRKQPDMGPVSRAFAEKDADESEDAFLRKEFAEINLSGIISESRCVDIIESRLEELKKCLSAEIPLSAVFLSGSILEAVLLSVALMHKSDFVQAKTAPKGRDDKVLEIVGWHLAAFIDTAKELGYIQDDVCKFCHAVRDFRNYIHPYHQMRCQFSPSINTAKICFQVVKGAIAEIREKEGL